jgi:hypothetical protein
VSHQYILVSLRGFADITKLIANIRMQEGVFRIGALEYSPECPEVQPYFFVYVEAGIDLEPIAAEIRKDPNVAEAGEPPARYAI